MTEVRRLRIKCEIEQLAAIRERIHRIRDDEDRAIAAGMPGAGSQGATDLLSEAGLILLVVMDKLRRAKQ